MKSSLISKITRYLEERCPLYHWWKARKVFKPPRIHLMKGKNIYFFGYPLTYNKIFSINTSALGFKPKYESFRHEWNPYFAICIFGYQFVFIFHYYDNNKNSYLKNLCTWEAMLDYIYKQDSIKTIVDNHTWRNGIDEVTIIDNLRKKVKKDI